MTEKTQCQQVELTVTSPIAGKWLYGEDEAGEGMFYTLSNGPSGIFYEEAGLSGVLGEASGGLFEGELSEGTRAAGRIRLKYDAEAQQMTSSFRAAGQSGWAEEMVARQESGVRDETTSMSQIAQKPQVAAVLLQQPLLMDEVPLWQTQQSQPFHVVSGEDGQMLRMAPDIFAETTGHVLAPLETFSVSVVVDGGGGQRWLKLENGTGWAHTMKLQDGSLLVVEGTALTGGNVELSDRARLCCNACNAICKCIDDILKVVSMCCLVLRCCFP